MRHLRLVYSDTEQRRLERELYGPTPGPLRKEKPFRQSYGASIIAVIVFFVVMLLAPSEWRNAVFSLIDNE